MMRAATVLPPQCGSRSLSTEHWSLVGFLAARALHSWYSFVHIGRVQTRLRPLFPTPD